MSPVPHRLVRFGNRQTPLQIVPWLRTGRAAGPEGTQRPSRRLHSAVRAAPPQRATDQQPVLVGVQSQLRAARRPLHRMLFCAVRGGRILLRRHVPAWSVLRALPGDGRGGGGGHGSEPTWRLRVQVHRRLGADAAALRRRARVFSLRPVSNPGLSGESTKSMRSNARVRGVPLCVKYNDSAALQRQHVLDDVQARLLRGCPQDARASLCFGGWV